MRSILSRVECLGGLALVLLLWWVSADLFKCASPMLLPPLGSVLHRSRDLLFSGLLWPDFIATSYRWAMGFGLGACSGALVGLLLGMVPRMYRFFELPIEFVRTMPVTAIFPLYLLVFGIDDASKIAMAFTPTFLLMLINAAYGVTHAAKGRLHMARVFGASGLQIFSRIIFFEALPQIFIGLRLAISLSLVVTVVSEMFIGTQFGLGQRVFDSYLTNNVTTLYAILILLGVMGYALNKLIFLLERKWVFWAGRV